MTCLRRTEIPLLSLALQKTAEGMYRNVVKAIVASPVWALSRPAVWEPGGVMLHPIVVVLSILAAGPTAAGVFFMMSRIPEDRKLRLRDIPAGAERYFARSVVLASAFSLVLGACLASCRRYGLSRGGLHLAVFLFQLGVLCFFVLTQLYTFPLTVSEDLSAFRAFSGSVNLALRQPLFSVALLAVLLAVALVLSFAVVGLAMLYMGTVSMLLINATVVLRGGVKRPARTANDGGSG